MTTQADKDSMVSEFRHRKGKRVLPFSSGSTGDPLKMTLCLVILREREREREREIMSNVLQNKSLKYFLDKF